MFLGVWVYRSIDIPSTSHFLLKGPEPAVAFYQQTFEKLRPQHAFGLNLPANCTFQSETYQWTSSAPSLQFQNYESYVENYDSKYIVQQIIGRHSRPFSLLNKLIQLISERLDLLFLDYISTWLLWSCTSTPNIFCKSLNLLLGVLVTICNNIKTSVSTLSKICSVLYLWSQIWRGRVNSECKETYSVVGDVQFHTKQLSDNVVCHALSFCKPCV